MIGYILAAIVGALVLLFANNKRNSQVDSKYQQDKAKSDNTIATDTQAAAKAQETADELTKKFEDELRDYGAGDPNKPH